MSIIKPPSGVQTLAVPPTGGAGAPSQEANQVLSPLKGNTTVQPQETPPAQGAINPEAVAKALKDYQKLRDKLKQPALSGAAGLFTENVIFPSDLLDPQNPANDPKYLHMLLALFGLKEMKQYFMTDEQKEEESEFEEIVNKEDQQKEKKPVKPSPKKNGNR